MMKYWRLDERPKQQSSGFVDRTADGADLALYTSAETAQGAFEKFEGLCGPLKRNEYMVTEVKEENLPEDVDFV